MRKSAIKKQSATAPATESQTPAPQTAAPVQAKPVCILPYVNYEQREENRALSTESVLDLLRNWLPEVYGLAEVVGKWVWVAFPEQPVEPIRAGLSQLGFHWNNTRKCWQHPCGETLPRGQQNPREKYATYFPADRIAA